MFLLCHLWFTTTDLSQRFPILETSAYKMFTPGSFATEELLEKKTLNTRFTGMPKNFYTRTCLILSAFFSGSLAGILNSNFQQPLKSSVLQQLSSRATIFISYPEHPLKNSRNRHFQQLNLITSTIPHHPPLCWGWWSGTFWYRLLGVRVDNILHHEKIIIYGPRSERKIGPSASHTGHAHLKNQWLNLSI